MNLTEEIKKLKQERNALILAHYYQRPEIQEIADFVGDSYYLSKIAKDSDKDLIVFCGVKFMAESAKILSPNKTVLLPASDAGCPMAEMANPEELEELKKKHPNAAVVCYINSTTEVKALCDVSVTSSNAVKILSNLKEEEIIFLPDKNLGSYLQEKLPQKKFILWNGFCITHHKVKAQSVVDSLKRMPDAKALAHPECEKEVRDVCHFIGSTSEIIDFATESSGKNFLIVTEEGVLHALKQKNPDKNFYFPTMMTCVNMKKTRLEDVYNALSTFEGEIKLDEKIRLQALGCLQKMHELAR
jgi:quinolinate synthase